MEEVIYIIKHTHARTHAKEEGSSNIARQPAERLANGDSFEFIQKKTPLCHDFFDDS